MKKVAVFGKPANGKSTLSKKLANVTGIALYSVDSMLYQADGKEIERACYEEAHDKLLAEDSWIIEGFAPLRAIDSFHKRLGAADTLIYIDLPYPTSYWLVTKRLMKGLFKTPEGWPAGSSILKGSLQSYRTLKHCPKFWNDDFLQRLNTQTADKKLYVIKTVAELDQIIEGHVL